MLIWTNHATKRLGERGLTKELIIKTLHAADKFFAGKEKGTIEYQKRFGQSRVTVITKHNERSDIVILSCWIDPPLPGTKDAKRKERYHAYLRAGFWKKVWMTILKQIAVSKF